MQITKTLRVADREAWRAWLAEHHATEKELLVGFYKRGSGRPSITWPESVDQALCFGWIDGVRHSLGASAYTIRFTPRKPTSIWSAVNVARVAELTKLRKNRKAAAFFDAQPPWYRRTATHWVISAKREETRERRLAQLVADCAAGRTIAPLTRKPPSSST